MKLNEYQESAKATAIFPKETGLVYCALGLCGESGEVADKLKRVYRDPDLSLEDQHEGICKELGDVLWYLSNLADQLGVSLEEIAEMNLKKLRDRAERNVLKGEGDER